MTPALVYLHHPAATGFEEVAAFDAHLVSDRAPGTVLTYPHLPRSLQAAKPAVVGGLIWDRGTHLIEAIYVVPTRRREGIGTALVAAAVELHRSATGKLLTFSPVRTALGEVFAPHTCAGQSELSTLALPGTAEDQIQGARPNQLVPDDPEVIVAHPACQHLDLPYRVLACHATREPAELLWAIDQAFRACFSDPPGEV